MASNITLINEDTDEAVEGAHVAAFARNGELVEAVTDSRGKAHLKTAESRRMTVITAAEDTYSAYEEEWAPQTDMVLYTMSLEDGGSLILKHDEQVRIPYSNLEAHIVSNPINAEAEDVVRLVRNSIVDAPSHREIFIGQYELAVFDGGPGKVLILRIEAVEPLCALITWQYLPLNE